ncbi:MAG: DUF3732 domain-containing protein [Actinomycetota bacterium]|nr:DUF3732 domain-containing protein [Actinomycetota bacterium]
MKLLALAVYNAGGDRREVRFREGLNIVTGTSGTGKSALLDMVEYCLGRNTLTTPVGPIRDTVVWYGLLVQLSHQRAFIGRPAPSPGAASTQRGMLEFGTALDVPEFSALGVNADTDTIRDQLGRAIGIDENTTEQRGLQVGFEANLGHAVLFCLQAQSEIANRSLLFHRQGEEGIARALQEVLPYFLGAVARDRAVLRQQLLAARRSLRAAENELRSAEAVDEEMDVRLQALLTEARAAGLLDTELDSGTAAGLEALRAVAAAPVSEVALDDEQAAQREQLRRRREDLRQQLYQVGQERAVLEALETDESDYEGVVAQQTARLHSLELLGPNTYTPVGDCPVCGSSLPETDPSVEELRAAAAELQAQAGSFAITRPRRRQALEEVEARAAAARGEMRAIEQAIDGIEAARQQITADRRFAERQAFLQGRISHYLDTVRTTDDAGLKRLRERVRLRQATVEHLESQLDQDEEREQLLSRLLAIGGDMTVWADRLALEHSGTSVRLDPRRLTVVADTPFGPAPLNQIGSAANWIGYHLVAHLALHKFFVEQDRPVPRFLMLDQPTQAYYPSDVTRESGLPGNDADRAAVQSMYELLAEVAALLDNRLQIILCDHANLPDDWFQEAVIENWRDGRRLIPDDWLTGA